MYNNSKLLFILICLGSATLPPDWDRNTQIITRWRTQETLACLTWGWRKLYQCDTEPSSRKGMMSLIIMSTQPNQWGYMGNQQVTYLTLKLQKSFQSTHCYHFSHWEIFNTIDQNKYIIVQKKHMKKHERILLSHSLNGKLCMYCKDNPCKELPEPEISVNDL